MKEMGDTEYSYELTVNIVAEMVLDYMSKNTNMDKDILRKNNIATGCNQKNDNEENQQDECLVA